MAAPLAPADDDLDRTGRAADVLDRLALAGGETSADLAGFLAARGSAVATGAGRLPARHVIHGAVMGQDLTTDAGLVRQTMRACLALADELGCASLALPAFGTGVGGFPLEECARVMVDEVRAFELRSLERVVFAVFGLYQKWWRYVSGSDFLLIVRAVAGISGEMTVSVGTVCNAGAS